MSEVEATRSVVRKHHQAWSNGRFEEAFSCLAPSLVVEVPINAYPRVVHDAVRQVAHIVRSVDTLCELAGAGEAMVLYDLELTGLGALRVVEHFTVEGGFITRVRQIHDTMLFRAGAR